jgi:hypothetical protein
MPPDGFVRDSESHEDLRQVKAQCDGPGFLDSGIS